MGLRGLRPASRPQLLAPPSGGSARRVAGCRRPDRGRRDREHRDGRPPGRGSPVAPRVGCHAARPRVRLAGGCLQPAVEEGFGMSTLSSSLVTLEDWLDLKARTPLPSALWLDGDWDEGGGSTTAVISPR